MMPAKRQHLKGALPDMSEYLKSVRRLALASAIVAAVLSGCAPVSLKPEDVRTAEQAIDAASQIGATAERQRFLLRAAADFQKAGDHPSARRVLQAEALQTPEETVEAQYRLLAMSSAVALEDYHWAENLAALIPPDQHLRYPDELKPAALDAQYRLYNLAGEPMKAALTLMGAAPETSGLELQELNDRIWQALKRSNDDLLNEAATTVVGFESQGWLELAARMREPGLSLEAQGRIIREWRFNWLGHPAAELPPSELRLIATLLQQQPGHIALTLPLSGPLAEAGKMVRDGFLAAFYDAETARASDENGTSADGLRITITDSHGKSASELLEILMRQSPDMIVGPLEKETVTALGQMESLPVPVLALNYVSSDASGTPANLTQFGLSAEDEARQIADQVIEEGLGQVLVLIPRGEWGDRIEQALSARLGDHGGIILNSDRYFGTDNFREITADLLGINTSRQRALELQRTIGRNVEFEPRRRQDADAIIMVAQPTIARQFNPLFGFYFAGNIPVFSPSVIYEGQPDPSRDRDLNGVRFTDIPWILEPDTEFRATTRTHFQGVDGPLGRLFAMGADAWALSSRLPLMQQVDDTRYSGHTGTLALDRQGRIHRSQLWARFENGSPVTLKPVSDQDEGNIATD
ncbi:penicillin-binding protein activator [uncultured Marinobacter sp.]|uniref:penicillin-binding protein activator n=1 Tax=uncultured Marinobacter sp. TaxID=187379 RepID=UPI0030DA5E2E